MPKDVAWDGSQIMTGHSEGVRIYGERRADDRHRLAVLGEAADPVTITS